MYIEISVCIFANRYILKLDETQSSSCSNSCLEWLAEVAVDHWSITIKDTCTGSVLQFTDVVASELNLIV